MKCPVCEHEMIWNNDFDFEDLGKEGNGIVSQYHCPNCESELTAVKREKDDE